MKPGDLIEEARALAATLHTGERRVVDHLEPVMRLLQEGKTCIPFELPWPSRPGSRHLVVLESLEPYSGRVRFFNVEADPVPSGTPLQGPERRAEGPSRESIELSEFVRLFSLGQAYALIPTDLKP